MATQHRIIAAVAFFAQRFIEFLSGHAVQKVTVYGFPSALRGFCGIEAVFPGEVAEAALAHKVGNAVEQAYRRSSALDKRRKLMEAWAAFCEPNKTGKVVSLTRKKT